MRDAFLRDLAAIERTVREIERRGWRDNDTYWQIRKAFGVVRRLLAEVSPGGALAAEPGACALRDRIAMVDRALFASLECDSASA